MTTGYVFEEIFMQHDSPGHPESALRLYHIAKYLREHKLLPLLTRIPGRPATRTELERCHPSTYIDMVKAISERGGGMIDGDTYSNSHTFEAASTAVGSLIELCDAVMMKTVRNGFAIVRPPGHHAEPHQAMGFCLFGTVALAARALQADHGLERIAIIDFDVHHGNGTQAILDLDHSIYFVSSHQYPFYPGTGGIKEVGYGNAKGTKLNVPLSEYMGDKAIQELYEQIVFPALNRFQPEFLIISAGYDAHWNDPLANVGLTLTGYHWLCQKLLEFAEINCDGRIVFSLEGGYNLEVLAAGVGNTFRALLGHETIDDPFGEYPFATDTDVSELITKLKKTHYLP